MHEGECRIGEDEETNATVVICLQVSSGVFVYLLLCVSSFLAGFVCRYRFGKISLLGHIGGPMRKFFAHM